MAELGSNTSPLSSVVHHHETALWAPTTLFLHLLCLPFPAQLSSARKRNLFSLLKLQRRKTLIFFFFLLDHIKEKNNLEKARKFPFSPKGNKLSNCEEWRRSASSSQSSHDKCICLLCYSIHGTSLVAKSCLTCESMDCSLPGSSVHGIHQESKYKVPIGAWVSFWAFCLVPLVCVTVFVPVPYCLDDYSFVV